MVRRTHGEDGLVGHVEGSGHRSPNSLVVPAFLLGTQLPFGLQTALMEIWLRSRSFKSGFPQSVHRNIN